MAGKVYLSRLKEDSRALVEELLENREYFADIDNAKRDAGEFSGESLKAAVEELGDTFYERDVDFEKVEWERAAVYLNGKLG